uniref:Uncharacterized protein n=1 Tax=Arundo donax TaxID=35708 RepID=A0A0A9A0T4_ARUDO
MYTSDINLYTSDLLVFTIFVPIGATASLRGLRL